MVEYGQGPRSGSRDNGLRCAGYVAVGDLDPRIADALLETLRQEGIAAYVTPSPRTHGGWLEVQAPDQLTDRLYADAERGAQARELLASERAESSPTPPAVPSASPAPAPPPSPVVPLPPSDPQATDQQPTGEQAGGDPRTDEPATEIDFDSAWQQLLSSLQSTATQPTRPWPASEEVERGAFSTPAAGTLDEDPVLDEHFVPPPPPPLPRLRKETVGGLLAMLLGVLILGLRLSGGSYAWLGVLAILLGAVTLVWNVKDGPPRDSDDDDGAIV